MGLLGGLHRHGMPVAAKTLHALQQPELYGLQGPDADPAAARQVIESFDVEARAPQATFPPPLD